MPKSYKTMVVGVQRGRARGGIADRKGHKVVRGKGVKEKSPVCGVGKSHGPKTTDAGALVTMLQDQAEIGLRWRGGTPGHGHLEKRTSGDRCMAY